MAYEKKIWKNRQSEHPNRRTMTPVDGQANTYDVARAEGLVMEEGDAFDQDEMNDLEGRIESGIQAATSRTFTAVLPASGWTGSDDAGYTQTVSCTGMTADVVTLPPAIQPTGVRATDIAAREALGYISVVETLAGQVKVTCWESKPEVTLTIWLVEAR